MSERNYYVIRDDNCKFESMTKEEILAAITQAVEGHSIADVDTGFITRIKEQNGNAALKFWVGTQAQYNAIETKETNCFYIITDEEDDIPNIKTRLNALEAGAGDLESRVITLEDYHAMNGVALLPSGTTIPYGATLATAISINDISNYSVVAVYTANSHIALCYVFFTESDGVTTFRIIGTGTNILANVGTWYNAQINIAGVIENGVCKVNSNKSATMHKLDGNDNWTFNEATINKIVGIM